MGSGSGSLPARCGRRSHPGDRPASTPAAGSQAEPGPGRGRTARRARQAWSGPGPFAGRPAGPAPSSWARPPAMAARAPEASGSRGRQTRRSGRGGGRGHPRGGAGGRARGARAAPAGSRALPTLAHLAPRLSCPRPGGAAGAGPWRRRGGRGGRGQGGTGPEAQDSVEGTPRREEPPRTRKKRMTPRRRLRYRSARRRPRPALHRPDVSTSRRRLAPLLKPARYKGRLQRRKAASVAYPRVGPGGGCA